MKFIALRGIKWNTLFIYKLSGDGGSVLIGTETHNVTECVSLKFLNEATEVRQ